MEIYVHKLVGNAPREVLRRLMGVLDVSSLSQEGGLKSLVRLL